MKVLAVSDMHGQIEGLDPKGADIVIVAGDFAPNPRYAYTSVCRRVDVDVSLQTHSPHFGSAALTEVIRRAKPKLVFCGHIHTGDHRVHELKHGDGTMTRVYNVSRLNEDYSVTYDPRIEYVCKE